MLTLLRVLCLFCFLFVLVCGSLTYVLKCNWRKCVINVRNIAVFRDKLVPLHQKTLRSLIFYK